VKQTPAPIPSVPVPSQNDGSDLLGDLSQSKVSEPSNATGGLFDNMAVKAPVASTSSFSAGKENVEVRIKHIIFICGNEKVTELTF
jgi:hypothetical protein